MWLSNTKLNAILTDPASYFLNYKAGIKLLVEKPALAIGSAVHSGIEHNSSDLTDYFNLAREDYTKDNIMAEAMVEMYLNKKDEIFDEILADENGGKYEIVEEYHELSIYAKLPSIKYVEAHTFMGIIDLLLLVKDSNGELGFIVVDYKTSSVTPDWSQYLDQIYRYIFLIKDKFPDIPTKKIGIVNLQKCRLTKKASESNEDFITRMRGAYIADDCGYLKTHMYKSNKLDTKVIDRYINNLSLQADLAQTIEEGGVYPINYSEINGKYGRGIYADIIERIDDCYSQYKIKDIMYNPYVKSSFVDAEGKTIEYNGSIEKERPCFAIDMEVLWNRNLVNNYWTFVKYIQTLVGSEGFNQLKNVKISDKIKTQLVEALKSSKVVDDDLLTIYWYNLEHHDEINEILGKEKEYV